MMVALSEQAAMSSVQQARAPTGKNILGMLYFSGPPGTFKATNGQLGKYVQL
jgi:hypothetical protein